MPSILSNEDRETVKRQVPKASNKIQAVAVVRLYIAYPNRNKWTYTGLQGAAVLANDLVGHTYWVKLVDISPANRGVIWDQEIYDSWNYNQDRTFFHTFETQDCLVGLSFVDEKEAKAFLKKMHDREKNASKATKSNPFGADVAHIGSGHKHHLLGGFFGHRNSSVLSVQPTPSETPSYVLSPTQTQSTRSSSAGHASPRPVSEYSALDALDPNWRETWGDDLKQMGITDDLIRDNQDFIADYIRQQQAVAARAELPAPVSNGVEPQRQKAPPPPPPPPVAAPRAQPISPQTTGSGRGRGAPPAPPPARRSAAKVDAPQREPTPPQEPPAPKGPPPPRFAAPPPLPDAGKYAEPIDRASPRPKSVSVSNPGPPPPPRPAKVPADHHEPAESGTRFGVPPPFTGQRTNAPPPTPSRGPVPPPPPSRDSHTHSAPPSNAVPPPLPPKTPTAPTSYAPPLPPPSSRPVPQPPSRDSGPPPPPLRDNGPPPPPPLPHSHAPAPPPLPSSHAPPPPPLPSSSAPPP
ncbi:hypothetical protein B7463_g3847, partial [Scytalidium lignicola]